VEIEEVFLFFPRLHAIFASQPNITPICVTAAFGPKRCSTVWYQPPNHFIYPQLLSPAPAPPETPLKNLFLPNALMVFYSILSALRFHMCASIPPDLDLDCLKLYWTEQHHIAALSLPFFMYLNIVLSWLKISSTYHPLPPNISVSHNFLCVWFHADLLMASTPQPHSGPRHLLNMIHQCLTVFHTL
jgi:hypothetical protein